jgi:dihydrofolate reductase
VVEKVRTLKAQPGKNILMFGSNMLCVSLMRAGLMDEFQIVVNPVVLGDGTTLFKGLPEKAELKLVDTRRFKSGAMMLTYYLNQS